MPEVKPKVKFINGLFAKRRENSPSFLIVKLSFNEAAIDYLKENLNDRGYCNVDILRSNNGKFYAKLNEWKSTNTAKQKNLLLDIPDEPGEEIDVSKIQF